ncbi:MAG: putative DNA binding domain-containing protein [Ignavibacteriae bacterium]|nr:putative DNA binding domain-containing protein [Ignavibacteriota bacterium]
MQKKLNYKECETIELKRSLAERSEILETVSAFSNMRGGSIYIGVDPSGDVAGVVIGKKTLEDLANEIKQNTDPKVFPSINVFHVQRKDIIKISVQEYPTKPVWAYDKVLIRVGRTNQRASAETIRRLIKESQPSLWDQQSIPLSNIREVNTTHVRFFLRKAEEERNTTFTGTRNVTAILSKLHLLNNGNLTNAAILLFGKEPTARVLQAEVRCARFNGTTSVDFADMIVLEGTIIQQVPEALNFIRRHINVAAKITGKPEREEIWEYPKEALREAIVNAICHRDYEDTGNVQIRIFDDRLEVWSPGMLPAGITLESLKHVHESKPRNTLIARCFFLIKYIEQWGTGTNRIIDLCKEAGLPVPEFSVTSGSFVVTFKRTKKYKKTATMLQLNKTQEKIVDLLKKYNDGLSPGDIAKYLHINRRTVQRNLSSLTPVVQWTGKTTSDPRGRYILTKEV